MFIRSLMRSRYPQSFLLHEIEEKGFGETILPDFAVDFYHYSIERRCRRHYTPATRLLERKMGKDERKMGRRRGGWFLILWRIGEGRGIRCKGKSRAGETISRINLRLSADSIDGHFSSWKLPETRRYSFGNWSKEFVRERVRFMNETKRLCFR